MSAGAEGQHPSAAARFNGADYDHERDSGRLTSQLARIRAVVEDGKPRTLKEIAALTGDPEASVSAQLRHLRKPRFGSNTIERRYLGDGLYEYRFIPGFQLEHCQ